MKSPGASFDVTAVTETICDTLRARLPAIVAREVAAQLRAQGPRLAELEMLAQRALTARRGRGIRDDDDGAP
jgi:hypothetical protein